MHTGLSYFISCFFFANISGLHNDRDVNIAYSKGKCMQSCKKETQPGSLVVPTPHLTPLFFFFCLFK